MGTESQKRGTGEAASEGRFPGSEVLRETFLAVLDPDEADTFRRCADVIQDRLLDRAAYAEREPKSSYTLAEMSGVVDDLWFLEDFLLHVASERQLSELTPTEQALASFAGQLAPKVRALAQELEQELERQTSDDTAPIDPQTPGGKK